MSDVIEVMARAANDGTESLELTRRDITDALRAAEKAGWRLVPVESVLEHIRARADSEYCGMIRQDERPECLGWEAKVNSGEFGESEMDAHIESEMDARMLCGELLGRHRGLCEAVWILQAAPRPWNDA